MLGFWRAPPPGAPVEQLPTDVVIAATLGRIEHELRMQRAMSSQAGRRQVISDGLNLSGGAVAGVIIIEGPKSGADWLVERIAITASGASAAAILAIYQGARIDELRLIDQLPSLAGNAPSRGTFAPNFPYLLEGGQPLLISFAAVVANGACTARVQMKEVEGQLDPEMQNQFQ